MVRYAAVARLAVVALLGACAPSRDTAPQGPGAQGTSGLAPVLVASTAPATPPSPPPTTAPETSPGAVPSTAATAVPAAPLRTPSTPATAILRAAVALEPAAVSSTAPARVRLVPGAETVVDPGATFEVELSAPSSDARLVLVDARDDHVAASATREVTGATRLTLSPAAPLVPGSRYALRVDGAADRDLHDGAGRAFSAVTLPLLVAGSPPPPEPKKQAPAKKRRRR